MVPMADPVGCLVAQANPSNVRHVLVAGRFVKRDGELVGVDVPRAMQLANERLRTGRRRISDQGVQLLPPAPEGFADAINTVAASNLARAWGMPAEGS